MSPPRLIHDLPDDDLVAHTASNDCICGPSRRPLDDGDPDAPRTFVITHARLDGKP